jgi:hypothetical protein
MAWKLFQIIHAGAVEPHHVHEFLRHGAFEFLVDGPFAAGLEFFGQFLEIDVAQIDQVVVARRGRYFRMT